MPFYVTRKFIRLDPIHNTLVVGERKHPSSSVVHHAAVFFCFLDSIATELSSTQSCQNRGQICGLFCPAASCHRRRPGFSIVLPTLWPYLREMQSSTQFLAAVVAAYSVGEGLGGRSRRIRIVAEKKKKRTHHPNDVSIWKPLHSGIMWNLKTGCG